MFTGIIEEVGKVSRLARNTGSAVLTITSSKVTQDLTIGDSIAVNGVCLTVVSFNEREFAVDVMHETLDRSTIGSLNVGELVNLERAMLAGGRFGGHIVSGHIDGKGHIIEMKKDDIAVWFTISAETTITKYIIEKGSIAIDGISLTVAGVNQQSFCVSVIPHTLQMTSLGCKKIGDKVNLEADCIGKYVEKLLSVQKQVQSGKDDNILTESFLQQNGFF